MGNWRTINIVGTMSEADAAKLTNLLNRSSEDMLPVSSGKLFPEESVWHKPYACLSFNSERPGLCGIGAWPSTRVNRAGNLAERGFTVYDVEEALRALVEYAPTMNIKVHCGDEYESTDCVATISVKDGLVMAAPPEVSEISEPSEDQVLANLRRNLFS